MRVREEDARRILSDTEGEKCFWVNNGPIIKNIQEIPNTLKSLDNMTFKHHVNKDKNDFANWVNDVMGDISLAKALRKTKTKNTTIKKIKDRINYLKKIAK